MTAPAAAPTLSSPRGGFSRRRKSAELQRRGGIAPRETRWGGGQQAEPPPRMQPPLAVANKGGISQAASRDFHRVEPTRLTCRPFTSPHRGRSPLSIPLPQAGSEVE